MTLRNACYRPPDRWWLMRRTFCWRSHFYRQRSNFPLRRGHRLFDTMRSPVSFSSPLFSFLLLDGRSGVDGLSCSGWRRANIRVSGDESQTSCSPPPTPREEQMLSQKCWQNDNVGGQTGSVTVGAKMGLKRHPVVSCACALDTIQDFGFDRRSFRTVVLRFPPSVFFPVNLFR